MNDIVVVHGSYYANNFGDTLLIKMLCDRLSYVVGKENVYLAVKGHSKEQNSIGYPVIDRKMIPKVKKVFYSGGGYFGEPSGNIISRNLWAIRNYFRHIYWLKKYRNAQLFIIGVGVGPLKVKWFRSSVEKIFLKSNTILVRDQESSIFCRDYFPDINNINICVDYALSLKPISYDKDGVGIHIMGLSKNEIEIVFKAISKTNINSNIFIIFDSEKSYSKANIDTYRRAALVAGMHGRLEFLPYENCKQLIHKIASLEFIITNKLHVGIVAISQFTPVISIPTHSKTSRLYNQLNISEYCINRKDLSLNLIIKKLNHIDLFKPDRKLILDGINIIDNTINKIFQHKIKLDE